MSNPDATNPKDKIGMSKLPWHVVPWRAMQGVCLALFEGALKYGPFNWRTSYVRASVYFSATTRHLTAWWEGENNDPQNPVNLNHIDKAIASLLVLRDAMHNGTWIDDRPPQNDLLHEPEYSWLEEGNEKAKMTLEAHERAQGRRQEYD